MDQELSQQHHQKRRYQRIAIAVLLSLVFAGSAWAINHFIRPSVAINEIRVGKVRIGAIDNTINAAGIVVPVKEEQVASPNQTRIAKVLLKAGQAVKKDQVIMVLDDFTIRLALDNLREQVAQQDIRANVLTMEMETTLKKLASEIELLELDLQSNKVKLSRFQKLGANGITSAVDLQAAELAVKRNEVQLRQTKELLHDTRKTSGSNVQAARLQKSIYQKQLDMQQRLLDQTQVKAPFDGLLTWLIAEEGSTVNTGQMIAKVSELNNFKVEASVSDFFARYLKEGQAVRVEYSGQILQGQVQTILPEIQNGTVKLFVSLDQANHPLLRHKLRVEANIVTDKKEQALIVDLGVAINGKGRQEVFVLENGQAVKRSIEIGLGDNKVTEVIQGAQLGEQIVISDVSRFKHLNQFRVVQ
jgi:HlyD family secretion protein